MEGDVMSHEPVPSETLDKFVSNKYHWKSLSTDQQKAMAVELQYHRYMEPKLYAFLDEVMQEKKDRRDYRNLIGSEEND
jgi:hypothetical protein